MSNEIACIKVTVIYLKGQTLLELKGKKCLRMFLNNEILNVTTKKTSGLSIHVQYGVFFWCKL